jgi:predicted pyridoxine 5'-phosphate oxidase superfamily flavin-nucleotide-binding protein
MEEQNGNKATDPKTSNATQPSANHDADMSGTNPIVMQDECGDSLWDAVLDQQPKDSLPPIDTHAKNYAELAFTTEVKKMQERLGSRASYARMEKNTYVDGLTENEMSFIAAQDSLYMATIGENGYPYIQHRGGPKGFLKVINANQVGFVDFSGNRQYISVGNLATNNKVAIIMVDYPARARLKIYAQAEIVELKNHDDIYALLDLGDYKFRPERMIVLHISAYDWNCPQHITPRYTAADLEHVFKSQADYINKLESDIETLKERLKAVSTNEK